MDLSKQILNAKTDNEKWLLWENALKTHGDSLEETLIRENLEYLGWTRKKVLDCWGEKGTERIKQKWLKENPKTEAEINHYYNTLKLYIPELSSWHCIKNNECLLKIIEFLQLAVENNCSSFLDFGAGIGSNGIFFAHYDFSVTLADISDEMLAYQKWRLTRHKVNANFIDLKKESLPKEAFNCATAIEVLEHITDPVKAMDQIRHALKIGGLVFVTTPFFDDEERPQHIIHDINITNEFEKLRFETVARTPEGLYRVYKRVA